MIIKILGTPKDDVVLMFENVKSAVVKLGLFADEILIISDSNDIKKYGDIALPALIIDEVMISNGSVLTTREVMELIESQSGSDGSCGCSCGGGCGC